MSDSEKDRGAQLLLDIGRPPSMAREDLIVTRANREAVMLVEAWPEWPGPTAILAGPPGSGKTHLASIWASVADAHPCNPKAISPTDLDAAQSGRNLVLDGIEPGQFDEDALFHVMNAVRANSGSLLMTSSYWPGAWKVLTPDLRSRIQAANTVEIDEPDDSLLVGVMAKLFADRQIAVDPGVIEYVAIRIERSLDSAREIVDLLDKAALARKARITRQFATGYIRDFDSRQSEFGF